MRAKGGNQEDIHTTLSLSLVREIYNEREIEKGERKEGLSEFHEQRERGKCGDALETIGKHFQWGCTTTTTSIYFLLPRPQSSDSHVRPWSALSLSLSFSLPFSLRLSLFLHQTLQSTSFLRAASRRTFIHFSIFNNFCAEK